MTSEVYIRKKLIINPSFQYRLIGFFFIISIVMSLLILGFSWKTYSSFVKELNQKEQQMSLYTDLINEYIEPGASVFWMPKDTKSKILIKLSIFTFVFALIVIYIGVLISHKIAGPLHRLNNCLLAIAKDEPVSPLKFRDRDEFQNLADSFNKCVNHMKEKNDLVKQSNDDLIKKLEKFIETVDDRQIQEKLIQITSQYKI